MATKRRRRNPGWVPNQHGAWAMLALPAIVGVGLVARHDGLHWVLVPLIAAWFVGYFAFNAVSLWAKAARRERFRTPVLTYGVATVVLLLIVVAAQWRLATWGGVYAPLAAAAIWAAAQRKERALWSGGLTVLAAATLIGVIASTALPSAGNAIALLRATRAGTTADVTYAGVVVLGYLFGTILVVKTVIRERHNVAFRWWSIGYHAVLAVAALAVALTGAWSGLAVGAVPRAASVAVAVLAVLAVARAAVLPWLAGRGRPVSPMQVGMLELVLSVGVAVALLLP